MTAPRESGRASSRRPIGNRWVSRMEFKSCPSARLRKPLPSLRVRGALRIPAPRREPGAWTDSLEKVGRHEQCAADCLAMLLKPGRHAHCVAEIGDLATGIPAFADHHRARMQPGARSRLFRQNRPLEGRSADYRLWRPPRSRARTYRIVPLEWSLLVQSLCDDCSSLFPPRGKMS
jgi:hypothetical protein